MADEQSLFLRRMQELASRAEGWYTFSDFLTPAEQSWLLTERLPVRITLWGGAELCERRMAAFGDPEDFGIPPEFPFVCISCTPKSQKYADPLSHRDILGAVLSLGLDRRGIGDIFINDNVGYLFAAEHLAPYICENLTRIRRTDVICAPCEAAEELLQPRLTEKDVVMASRRADAALCAAFHLSRSEGAEKFRRGLVFRNSLPLEDPAAELRDGDILSLRGAGRFRLEEVTGETGKGRLHARISLYG